jgi:hypothetical protein
MSFVKPLDGFNTEVTSLNEDDYFVMERGGTLYKFAKHHLYPNTVGYFLASGLTNTLVTTTSASPTPLLATTWTTTTGSETANMSQSITSNRKTLTYNAPAGLSGLNHRFFLSGVAVFQKSGGGDTTFNMLINRGGSWIADYGSRFTLTDDTSYVPIAISQTGSSVFLSAGETMELGIVRVSGTGDIILKGCFISGTGLKYN